MQHIAVFCGSNPGHDPAYLGAARALGAALGRSGRTLVYGGSCVGLMGALADATLAAGGKVIGVIPRALREREIAHPGLSELLVVDSMHERKAAMAGRAEAFIAMAGGLGTLDELFEAWTWAQLGHHQKPLGILETNGLFAPLLGFLDGLVTAGFLMPVHRNLVVVSDAPDDLLARLQPLPPSAPKWTALPRR